MTKQNKYYNLNIKLNNITKKSSKPDLYDATKNLERKRAPIFFGPYKPEEYINAYKNNQKLEGLDKKQLNEAYNFIQLYKEDPEARLITIDQKIWIYKIIGQIKYESTDETIKKKDDQITKIVPKYYDVEIIREYKKEDVPYILASMKENQAFSRNTFRMIDEKKYGGNIAAIKFVIDELNDFKIDPLKTLSSVQLEFLVVKIFEKNGAFIPAWRGGTLKDIDIIAEFEGNIPDNLLIKKIEEKNIKIQVKSQLYDDNKVKNLKKSLAESNNFFLITADDEPHKDLKEYYEKKYLTSKWIKKQIDNNPEIKKWYKKCIEWLPTENRKETSFK
ncbi:MAG: hypothetical protein FJ150_10775 [Euryarchaeota archaeon]|nr:hypothetical protein [Euryarchaeota archaeon]